MVCLILMKASNWSICRLRQRSWRWQPAAPEIYCILQTGYFKAKHAFFHFSLKGVESDFDFVVQRYFREISLTDQTITDHEYYARRKLITDFFGYHQ